MSSITVSWQGILSAANEYNDQRRELASCISRLRGVKSYRVMSGREFSSIYRVLGKVIDSLEDDKKNLKKLHEGLIAVKEEYTRYENKITEHMEIKGAADVLDKVLDEVGWSAIGNAGIVGGFVSTIGRFATSDKEVQDYLGLLSNTISVVGNGAKLLGGRGTYVKWKEAFGLYEAFEGLDMSAPGKAFTSSFEKQMSGFRPNATTVGEKIAVGAKWAGAILTGAMNLCDNIEEFKGQDGKLGRILAETGVETAVDIGLGMVATAGVTALAAAAGITAAPAVVAGAAATGVVWAANKVCKWVTGGKDIGEVAADAVCGGVEMIAEGCNSFVKWAFG